MCVWWSGSCVSHQHAVIRFTDSSHWCFWLRHRIKIKSQSLGVGDNTAYMRMGKWERAELIRSELSGYQSCWHSNQLGWGINQCDLNASSNSLNLSLVLAKDTLATYWCYWVCQSLVTLCLHNASMFPPGLWQPVLLSLLVMDAG